MNYWYFRVYLVLKLYIFINYINTNLGNSLRNCLFIILWIFFYTLLNFFLAMVLVLYFDNSLKGELHFNSSNLTIINKLQFLWFYDLLFLNYQKIDNCFWDICAFSYRNMFLYKFLSNQKLLIKLNHIDVIVGKILLVIVLKNVEN